MYKSNQVKSGNFVFTSTSIEGLKIVDVNKFGDERGYFLETYKKPDYLIGGISCEFVQDNQSSSRKNVLRGLHFQIQHPQAKLVRVVSGEVFDVAVDLRAGSPTYGKWQGVYLSADNCRQFFIPRGFAHGFLVMSETAEFSYKCDEIYYPSDQGGIRWDDSDVGIEWPLQHDTKPILIERDLELPKLSNLIEVPAQ